MIEFLIGEWVERKMDNRAGVVVEIQEYEGRPSYKVDFQRGADDQWWGTPDAWRPLHIVHAHVTGRSRDCDGEYRRGDTYTLTAEERCSAHGDLTFKERVLSSVISVYALSGTLDVTPDGAEWMETTDEGYRSSTIEWCDDDTCEGSKSWQRDLSAEAAGY